MSFAGIDTDAFPGLEQMAALKRGTNLSWCGYYLTAPSHHDASWLGHRAELAAQGWGHLAVYVGQEVAGQGSHLVDAYQGTLDGEDAGRKMAAEGFAKGACVALDLEAPNPESGYLQAWAKAVAEDGWTPGVYCSHLIANQVRELVPDARLWVFNVSHAPSHVQLPFDTPDVAGCGVPAAAAWQRVQNVSIVGDGYGLTVDLSVATTPDPGAP